MKIQKLSGLRDCLKPHKQLSYSSFWIAEKKFPNYPNLQQALLTIQKT